MMIFPATLENTKVRMNFRIRSREKVPCGHERREPEGCRGTYMPERPTWIQCGDPGSKRLKDQDSCALTARVNSRGIMVDAIAGGNERPRVSDTLCRLPETTRPGIGPRAKRERRRNSVWKRSEKGLCHVSRRRRFKKWECAWGTLRSPAGVRCCGAHARTHGRGLPPTP